MEIVGAPPALITYYDDATGEYSAVSAAELGDFAAATAALLTEGCGLRRGDRVAVLLPPHWETAAVLLGTWSAGLGSASPIRWVSTMYAAQHAPAPSA